MKTLFIILSSILLTAFTWGTPLSERMESYVNYVESECESWTKEDWARSKEVYSTLFQEYKQNSSEYSKEELDSIYRSIGKYNGLLVKKGMSEAGDAIGDFADKLPSLIDGFVGAFKSEDK